MSECFKYWFWSQSQGQFFIPDCWDSTLGKIKVIWTGGLTTSKIRPSEDERASWVLSAIISKVLVRVSGKSSESKQDCCALVACWWNKTISLNGFSWESKLKGKLLQFCGKQNQAEPSVSAKFSVWSLWKMKTCLSLVAGVLWA